MIANIFRGECSVHRQFMAAHLFPDHLAVIARLRRIRFDPGRKRNVFIILSVDPSHHLVLPDPSLMFKRREDGRLFRRKLRHHFKIYRFVGIETVDRVQITAEILGPVNSGELIFKRKSLELLLQFLRRSVLFLVPAVQGYGKIVQMQEIAGRQEDMLILSLVALGIRNYVQRNVCRVHDLFNIRSKALLLLRHIAVSLEPRGISLFTACLPRLIFFAEFVDLILLRLVIVVARMDRVAAEVKIYRHRVELCAGVAAISRSVPALQLIAKHQHVRQRVVLHVKRALALFLVLVERNRKLEQAVVQDYG